MAERVGFRLRSPKTAEILGFQRPRLVLGVTVRGSGGKAEWTVSYHAPISILGQ